MGWAFSEEAAQIMGGLRCLSIPQEALFLFDFLSFLLIRGLCNQFVDVVIPLPEPHSGLFLMYLDTSAV